MVPRTVIVLSLERTKQLAITDRHRTGAEDALKAQSADCGRCPSIGLIEVTHVHGADRGEIAFTGVVGPLRVSKVGRKFRDHEVQVRITLPVRIRRLIDRHAIDVGGEVGPVVEVEAPHQVLIGFALPAMGRNDESRHSFEKLTRTKRRRECKLVIDHDAFAGCRGCSDQAAPHCRDDHFLNLIRGRSWRRRIVRCGAGLRCCGLLREYRRIARHGNETCKPKSSAVPVEFPACSYAR